MSQFGSKSECISQQLLKLSPIDDDFWLKFLNLIPPYSSLIRQSLKDYSNYFEFSKNIKLSSDPGFIDAIEIDLGASLSQNLVSIDNSNDAFQKAPVDSCEHELNLTGLITEEVNVNIHESKNSKSGLPYVNETKPGSEKQLDTKLKKSSTVGLQKFVNSMIAKNKFERGFTCFKFFNYIENNQQMKQSKKNVQEDISNDLMVEHEDSKGKKKKGKSNKGIDKVLNSSTLQSLGEVPLAIKYLNYKKDRPKVTIGPSTIHRNGLFAIAK